MINFGLKLADFACAECNTLVFNAVLAKNSFHLFELFLFVLQRVVHFLAVTQLSDELNI